MTVRIGVDYDGVVADTQGFVIRFMREHFDVELARTDFGWVDGRLGIDRDLGVQTGEGYREFAANPAYLPEIEPIAGAADALRQLADRDNVTLHLATHRPEAVHEAIDGWLATHDFPPMEVPAPVPDDKARTSPSLDVLIDDYHGHVDAASRNGIVGVHLTTAWTSGEPTHPASIQAATWAEVLDAIEERTP